MTTDERVAALGKRANRYRNTLVLVVSLVLSGCGGDDSSTASETQHLVIVSGDEQEAYFGQTIFWPLVVLLTDDEGKAMTGRRVDFMVVEGDGLLSSKVTVTDEAGMAATTLTLGDAPGQVLVQAQAFGSQEYVTFRAQAQSPPLREQLVGRWNHEGTDRNEIYIFKTNSGVELWDFSSPDEDPVDRSAAWPDVRVRIFRGSYRITGEFLEISFVEAQSNDPDDVSVPPSMISVEITIQENTLTFDTPGGKVHYTRQS